MLTALALWAPSEPAPDDRVFADQGVPLSTEHLAKQLRDDLRRAGITRPELFERSATRVALRAHDLRATFVTVALAIGKSETWVADRTGHKSSTMINAYRRKARTWSGLELGALGPLDQLIPEIAPIPQGLPQKLTSHGWRKWQTQRI